ncbi:hypothetical protein L1887_37941 [Cichorium endivia]|nr:hypothetical protein L1887_37941 [Cichorium endivia]
MNSLIINNGQKNRSLDNDNHEWFASRPLSQNADYVYDSNRVNNRYEMQMMGIILNHLPLMMVVMLTWKESVLLKRLLPAGILDADSHLLKHLC